MARPPHLALPVAALAAVVVPLRSLHAFAALHEFADLVTLTYVSRVTWSLVAVVGFAAVGYAYAARTADGPRDTLAVAAIAALVGVLLGNLALALSTDVSWGFSRSFSLPVDLVLVGAYSVLDAATFGLLTLGGYALGAGEPS